MAVIAVNQQQMRIAAGHNQFPTLLILIPFNSFRHLNQISPQQMHIFPNTIKQRTCVCVHISRSLSHTQRYYENCILNSQVLYERSLITQFQLLETVKQFEQI